VPGFFPSHRLATTGDLPAIVDIYNSLIASGLVSAENELNNVDSRRAWFDEHQPETRPLWVVDQGEEIFGWLSFSNFHGLPAYSGTAELSIYLHEKARRQGLGRYLLEQAIAHAAQIKVHTLVASIFGHDTASMNLFASFNFEIWANMPRVAMLGGIERDLIIFGKRVN
jgi:L-amino acid N-acyltransferase YncA